MSRLYSGITSYWKKSDPVKKEEDEGDDIAAEIEKLLNEKNSTNEDEDKKEVSDEANKEQENEESDHEEEMNSNYLSDKKTDELIEKDNRSLVWRLGSGMYSTTTGAVTGVVGMGVGSVKWVAGKSYDAGSAVVGTTKAVVSKVPMPTLKRKDKKE